MTLAPDGRIAEVRPDKGNLGSWRDYCIKGARAGDLRDHPLRIRAPMKRVGDRYVAASYDEAIADIAGRLRAIIAEHGPDAFAAYAGNPAGFSFGSYSFTTALLQAVGSNSKFSVGSIDQNALLVAMEKMFGSSAVTLQPDIDASDFILLIGANPAISKMNWMGHTPEGWRRVLARVKQGAELVVIDPRRTETAAKATRYLPVLPGTDWALLLALLHVIFAERLERVEPAGQMTNLAELRALALAPDPASLATRCGTPLDEIRRLARDFAAAPRAFALVRTGSAQTAGGTIAEWLTMALNLVTGRIEAPGGRFMPGWPFRMPALARKAPPSPPPRPSRVRGLMPVGGGYSLAELPGEIETPGRGQVRALLINGANPVASGPDGEAMARALSKLELLVAIDLLQRESHAHAHWLIPAAHFLEREEVHVYLHAMGDKPFIQSSRAVAPLPEGMIPDWEFVLRLGDALGTPLYGGAIRSPDEFSDTMLQIAGLSVAQVRAHPHGMLLGERTTGHLWEDLADARIKADLCPPEFADELRRLLDTPSRDADYPFLIVSRRRNSTMNSWLGDLSEEDGGSGVVELPRGDAAGLGLTEGQRVRVRSAVGSLEVAVHMSDELAPGVALIEHGWGTRVFDPANGAASFSKGQMRNRLIDNQVLDPFSGTPRLNGMPVRIEPIAMEATQ
ncbi:MAG: molybdopterin-dependent oxidoreductase [Novosphingobium sp.]